MIKNFLLVTFFSQDYKKTGEKCFQWEWVFFFLFTESGHTLEFSLLHLYSVVTGPFSNLLKEITGVISNWEENLELLVSQGHLKRLKIYQKVLINNLKMFLLRGKSYLVFALKKKIYAFLCISCIFSSYLRLKKWWLA